MTKEQAIEELKVFGTRAGYSLKNILDVNIYEKPVEIQATINMLRCLYDILEGKLEVVYSDIEQQLLIDTMVLIYVLESNTLSKGVDINDDVGVVCVTEFGWSAEKNLLLFDIAKFIHNACKSIGPVFMSAAYFENSFIKSYMREYYGGPVDSL